MQRWVIVLLFFTSVAAQAVIIIVDLPSDPLKLAVTVVFLALFVISALLLWRGTDPIVSLRSELDAEHMRMLEAFDRSGGRIESATHLADQLGVKADQETYYKMQSLVERGLLQHRDGIYLTRKGQQVLGKRRSN